MHKRLIASVAATLAATAFAATPSVASPAGRTTPAHCLACEVNSVAAHPSTSYLAPRTIAAASKRAAKAMTGNSGIHAQ